MKLIGLFFWLNCAESADQPADLLLNRVRKDIAIEDYPFSGKDKQLFKNFEEIKVNLTFFWENEIELQDEPVQDYYFVDDYEEDEQEWLQIMDMLSNLSFSDFFRDRLFRINFRDRFSWPVFSDRLHESCNMTCISVFDLLSSLPARQDLSKISSQKNNKTGQSIDFLNPVSKFEKDRQTGSWQLN